MRTVFEEPQMEAVKIITPPAERKPCVCGARGLTYESALRRKLRLDLLSWGDQSAQRKP